MLNNNNKNNYNFLRLKKYEEESKLLTLELTNKSAELGKIYRKKENELHSNKNVFFCFLKIDYPCVVAVA